ncbi:MAG: Xaa-Pro peptidase family protein [Oscillospiraceae bacterium]|nr:Xaa-Pro peptidase family protein [Oscillospiraceae bacterium]
MNNIKKIQQELLRQDFDAMLITGQASRLYTGGFSSSAGAYVITPQDAWFFVDARYVEAARRNVKGAEICLVTTVDETFPEKIAKLLKEKEVKTVGFEDGIVTHATYLEWEEKFEAKLVPAQTFINDLRAIKSAQDLEGMIKAQRIAEKAFEEILPLIGNNITERELTAELVYRMVKNGADDKAFDPIVVSAPRSSLPHGVPTNEKIGNGFLTIDWGAKLDGWCSDCTRTLCIGKPDDEMTRVYETVYNAQEAGINAVCGGVKCSVIDSAARKVINDAGYGAYFGHGFGHSIGLEVHESIRCSQISEDIMPVGAVFTAEPGIYLPDRYGVRIEDTLYVTEDGCKNITNLPKNLIVI